MADVKISKIIREAAERGDPFAQFEIALNLEYGTDGEQNFEKAAEWYAKAADQGHRAAEGNFLLQHVLGQVAVRKPDVVFAQLKHLAESGDLEAANNVGLCHQFGYGTPKNPEYAANWFRRAAEGGLAVSQFNLAGLYYNGNGVSQDLGLAVEWYTRAAEAREELALVKLGHMYQNGIGVKQDLNRALLLYLIAYRRGSARAANHLGFLFKKGLGVERNDALSYALYLESVNEPDTPDIADEISYRGTAYFWLGQMSERGEGVKRNLSAAKRWYSRGAACGRSDCVEALTRITSKTKAKPRAKSHLM